MTICEMIKEMSVDEMVQFMYFLEVYSIGHIYCTRICLDRERNTCPVDDGLPCVDDSNLYYDFLTADCDIIKDLMQKFEKN